MKIIINGKTAEVSSGGTGSGSSITPQILVNVVDGATVTATKGSTTVTATSTNGVATLNIPSYGEWTITAQKDNSEPASTTVMVDIVKQYQVALKLDIVYICPYNGMEDLALCWQEQTMLAFLSIRFLPLVMEMVHLHSITYILGLR